MRGLQLVGNLFQPGFVTRREHDVEVVGGKQFGQFASDARRCSGNKWALITGASSGIGCELAKLFAADHFNVVLAARNETRLKQVADELQAAHGISAKVLPKDLSKPTAPAEIFEALRDIPISVLVNNAGFGWRGQFLQGDLQLSLDM